VSSQGLALYLTRMHLQARLRAALQNRGYLEVTTAVLQNAPGADPDLEPLTTDYRPLMEPQPGTRELFLHASPEFDMKRLLCRGLTAIYQIAPAFRQGEHGPRHTPEFTIAEWYRVGWSDRELMVEIETLIAELLGERARWQGREIGLVPPFPRIGVTEALRAAGADPAAWDGLPDQEWRDRFHDVYAAHVEPWLEAQGAVFLVAFPHQLAVLSRLDPQDPSRALRFELIIAGVEVANGCAELTDPGEHRRRFADDQDARRSRGRQVYPAPEALFADLDRFGLPPCAGVALGLDRLAMIAAGADRIEQVQAPAWLNAKLD
jgi:elongation factor P--(R)-beta-lysine ligase